jgi:hypothetical protein
MRSKTLWTLLILLALPLACSQAEDKVEEAASAAAEAVDSAAASAQEAADAASEKAAKMAEGAKEKATEAAAAAEAAAVELTAGDPAAKCSELAAKGAWSEALEVCEKAHEAEPDNMAIEHALQQARAAAE